VTLGCKKLFCEVPVRGHPSISLPPHSSPTLPLSICIPHPYLCTISNDHTYSRQLPGLTVRQLSRSWWYDSSSISTCIRRTSKTHDGIPIKKRLFRLQTHQKPSISIIDTSKTSTQKYETSMKHSLFLLFRHFCAHRLIHCLAHRLVHCLAHRLSIAVRATLLT
jgi:hypothetical protein